MKLLLQFIWLLFVMLIIGFGIKYALDKGGWYLLLLIIHIPVFAMQLHKMFKILDL